MNHPFKHFLLITHHRHLVIYNAFHMGIGWHSLRHDLSKIEPTEFLTSSKFYQGDVSPVYAERLAHNYYSIIAKHHTGRNKHHWEYWCDYFVGNMVIKTMPLKYALEYCADVISASKTYQRNNFKQSDPYNYVYEKSSHYFMTKASKEFILWCLKQYELYGFKGLKIKKTTEKYREITSTCPDVEMYKINLTEKNFKPGQHD